jgi:predicted O-methyltransferase YrrM
MLRLARTAISEAPNTARAWLNNAVDARWNHFPLGDKPHAPREYYLAKFEETRAKAHPDVEQVERDLGFAVDRAWLDELALHTQIVRKGVELSYVHGRLLYAALRRYLEDTGEVFVTVLETGTARGFSALCMAKAIADAGRDGRIVTVDVMPHTRRQIWNCIDDHEGPKSRAELLAPWSDLTRKIFFMQGDSQLILPRLGLERINFAFLDAAHLKHNVLAEFAVVARAQKSGDIVFFDDVTPGHFPGVVQAVEAIERGGDYDLHRLTTSKQRAYAWARRR